MGQLKKVCVCDGDDDNFNSDDVLQRALLAASFTAIFVTSSLHKSSATSTSWSRQ